MVVQQSLPLPCRGDFPVSRGEHVSHGLAKWWWALVAKEGKAVGSASLSLLVRPGLWQRPRS
jgi:hypothetical protein